MTRKRNIPRNGSRKSGTTGDDARPPDTGDDAPTYLRPKARGVWREVVELLKVDGLFDKAGRTDLRSLCELYIEKEQVIGDLKKRGPVIETKGRNGSTMTRANPAAQMLIVIDRRISSWLSKLRTRSAGDHRRRAKAQTGPTPRPGVAVATSSPARVAYFPHHGDVQLARNFDEWSDDLMTPERRRECDTWVAAMKAAGRWEAPGVCREPPPWIPPSRNPNARYGCNGRRVDSERFFPD